MMHFQHTTNAVQGQKRRNLELKKTRKMKYSIQTKRRKKKDLLNHRLSIQLRRQLKKKYYHQESLKDQKKKMTNGTRNHDHLHSGYAPKDLFLCIMKSRKMIYKILRLTKNLREKTLTKACMEFRFVVSAKRMVSEECVGLSASTNGSTIQFYF